MTIIEFINSGILELYVMGIASQSEQDEVEKMAIIYPEIRQEIDAISKALENYAMAHSIQPGKLVKPMLMATIDYSERIKNGETVTFPPLLHKNSKVKDYLEWISRPDLNIPVSYKEDIFAKIIGYTPTMTTAIVWIKKEAPREIHDHEFESFLIIEGTCNIIVSDTSNYLAAGDYFTIPLHQYHQVIVTSSIPCKAILQRIAA